MHAIVIDTSHQLLFTASMTGRAGQINSFCERASLILRNNNVGGKWHWSKLTRKTRDLIKKPFAALLENYPGVHFNVLQHRKPEKVDSKTWFIHTVPSRLAQKLEPWLQKKDGDITLIVDNDYNVLKGGNGTRHFIESLIRQFAIRLTGKETSIRGDREMAATIKQPNGKILNFYAKVAEKGDVMVGLVDIYLGIHISEQALLSSFANVHFSKIN